MEFYDDVKDDSQNSNITSSKLDEKLDDLEFSEKEAESIIAFLNTLNDDNFDKEIPSSVPSKLTLGGNIE